MPNTSKCSPLIDAIDLPRVNIEALTLDDLQSHSQKVLSTIEALNALINSAGRKSANEKRNALTLARKLRKHMDNVRQLIQAHNLAIASANSSKVKGSFHVQHGNRQA